MSKKPTYEELEQMIKQLEKPFVERKKAKKALLESEERYQLLLDSITDGCWVLDKEWRYTMVNKAGAELVGVSADKLVEHKITSLFPGIKKTEFFAAYERSMKKRTTERVSSPFIFPDGRKGFYEVSVYPVPEGILCIGTDITERKLAEDLLLENTRRLQIAHEQAIIYAQELNQEITERKLAEEALKKSEERYRLLVETMNDGLGVQDEKGFIAYVNNRLCEMLGYSRDEMIGHHVAEFADEIHKDLWKEQNARRRQGKLESYELFMKRKDGHKICTFISPRVLLDKHGQFKGSFAVITDISERKRAEEALRESEQKYRDLVENLNDVIYATDQNGTISYISPGIEKVAGYSPSEITGRPYTEFLHQEDLPRIMKQFDKVISGHIEPSEYRILTKSGEVRWVRTSSRAVMMKNRAIGLQGVLTDITDRKLAQERLQKAHDELEVRVKERTAELGTRNKELQLEVLERRRTEEWLRESEERFRQLAESIREVFWMSDPEKTQTIYISPAYEDVWGRTCQSLYEDPISFLDAIHPEDRERVIASFDNQRRGENIHLEYRIVQPNGSVRWIRSRGFPVHNEEGEVYRIAGIAEDFTERKQADEALRERNEALKVQADRLEELNTALKVLLERREGDKVELQEKVVSNVKELVLPYVDTLRNTQLDSKQMTYVNIIESNLKEIVSPFLRNLASKYFGLTPKEIQVAGLIKQGKTTKEIAELFNLSARAVKFHRQNIRAKLGLKNQRVNLGSYLLTLS